MREPPDAADLLRIAEATMRDTVLPALHDDVKYHALMVVRAIALARRELQAGDAPAEAEREALATLLGYDAPLPDLARALVVAIRAGTYDAGPARETLLAHLRDAVNRRLRETDPRAAPPP